MTPVNHNWLFSVQSRSSTIRIARDRYTRQESSQLFRKALDPQERKNAVLRNLDVE